jgi:elongation factor Ts
MITTEQLKQLRDETGISVMQCKRALEEAGGDIEKARVILKKKSGDVAAKKADRELGAGVIVTAQNANKAVMLTLLSETDFVAKNDDFVNMAKMLVEKVLASGKDGLEAASADGINELMQKVGENIKIGEVVETVSPSAGVYNHNGHFASIVVLKDQNADLAKDIAMHATAMRPTYLSESDIPDTDKENAKAVLAKEVEEQSAGKPEDMKAKILEGKINAYFKEQILLNQAFIKDPSKTIGELLKEAGNEIVSFKISQI